MYCAPTWIDSRKFNPCLQRDVVEPRVRRLRVTLELLKLTSTASTVVMRWRVFILESSLVSQPLTQTGFAVGFGTCLAPVLLAGKSCNTFTGSMNHMQKRKEVVSTKVLAFLLLAGLTLAMIGCGRTQAAAPSPPPEVRVAPVIQQDVPVYSEWVATLDGYVNAEIRPQVSGYIVKQDYKEGSLVRKGQLLFQIDPRPFKASLDRAKGDLAQAQAQLGKSTLDVERDTPLAEARAIAKSQLDNEIQAKLGAKAGVESSKAAVEQAELNLEWTKVISLVDGIAGIAQVQIGNLVGPNAVLTSVSQVEPIKAFFPISEHEYVLVQKSNAVSAKHTSSFFGKSLELILTDGSVYPQKGKILLADRQVDSSTGTIRIVAAFPNPGNILRPGQYGRVRVETTMKNGALLVPQSAVAQSQGSYQVAVVGSDHKVNVRTVKPGETVGTMWVIDEGLKPGEQVAVEGLQQLKEGTMVTPKLAHLSGEGN